MDAHRRRGQPHQRAGRVDRRRDAEAEDARPPPTCRPRDCRSARIAQPPIAQRELRSRTSGGLSTPPPPPFIFSHRGRRHPVTHSSRMARGRIHPTTGEGGPTCSEPGLTRRQPRAPHHRLPGGPGLRTGAALCGAPHAGSHRSRAVRGLPPPRPLFLEPPRPPGPPTAIRPRYDRFPVTTPARRPRRQRIREVAAGRSFANPARSTEPGCVVPAEPPAWAGVPAAWCPRAALRPCGPSRPSGGLIHRVASRRRDCTPRRPA